MFRRVMVTTDGRAAYDPALPVAAAVAAQDQAMLIVAHVTQNPLGNLLASGPFRPGYDNAYAACLERGEAVLAGVLEQLKSVAAKPLLLDGRTCGVAECLSQAVSDTHADLIVMGTHQRGDFASLLRGSVSQQVLSLVSVPLLLVPLLTVPPTDQVTPPPTGP
jgi:nucleotide-binding universal stress UspA family protein